MEWCLVSHLGTQGWDVFGTFDVAFGKGGGGDKKSMDMDI